MAKQRKASRHGIMNGRAVQDGGILAALPRSEFDPVVMAVDATTEGKRHYTPFEETVRHDVATAFTKAMEEDLVTPEAVVESIVDKHPEWRRGMPPTPPSGVKFIPPQQEPTQDPTLKYGRRPALRLTPEQENEIAELFREGVNTQEIADAYHIGQGRLYQIVKRHGVALRRQATTPEPQEAPAMPARDIAPAAPAAAPSAPEPNGSSSNSKSSWTVTYEITVKTTETLTVYGDNAGQAFVNAAKVLPVGGDIIAVQKGE